MDPFPVAMKILEKLEKAGGIAYIAGGAVRDFLMGRTPYDIDIATSLNVDTIRPLFDKTIEVGVQFGIIVVVEEGHQFEIATFRTDGNYLDGRRPESVLKGSAEEDAKRRDFTINGMFFNPFTEETIDFVGGKEDLKAKVIRAIGNPHDRFREDRLRMIRAIRYAARFEFAIDPLTQEAIKEHAPTLLPSVSFERILQEMEKMDLDGTLFHGLIEMHRLGLLQTIFPPLAKIDTLSLQARQKPKNIPLILQLKIFLEFLSDKDRFAWLERLKFSQKELELLTFSDRLFSILESPDLQKRVHAYASPHFEKSAPLLPVDHLHFAQDEQNIYKEAIDRIRQKKPLVTANDLLAHGIEKGPQMGQALKKAEEIALTHNLHSKDEVLRRLFPN